MIYATSDDYIRFYGSVTAEQIGKLNGDNNNGLMAAHDGELKLTENATRADAAQLLATLYKMIF